jgi:hypothetical protein
MSVSEALQELLEEDEKFMEAGLRIHKVAKQHTQGLLTHEDFVRICYEICKTKVS